jgi:hypothetical protein
MMGWMAPERHLGARMVVGETHHQREPSMSEVRWTPAARRINGRRLERNRKFVDSPLEEAVKSEPVSALSRFY